MKNFLAISGLVLLTALLFACGDSGGGGCHDLCDDQSALNCEGFSDATICKALCDGYAAEGGACTTAHEAYVTCANTQTFECGDFGPQPTDTEACGSEFSALGGACSAPEE